MNMIRLFGKPIRCNKSSQDKKTNEVGANLFIGNLEPEVDEKMLYDTFSAFGVLLFAKVMRDPDTGVSRGFGFISYDTFEASDAALAGMNGQFLCNRPISVSYAYKKETKGERHGSAAERLIAANRPKEGPGSGAPRAGGPATWGLLCLRCFFHFFFLGGFVRKWLLFLGIP
ncbi:Sf3b4 [Symbiodinium natans]|uniref:Splicing factor 3B subunit 4 n=1 Tax=Symbiodinium natans TaxID=878477 RepID=A0A812LMR2_9DINO|nr:Sf3b4 [Symbiodinium natans]